MLLGYFNFFLRVSYPNYVLVFKLSHLSFTNEFKGLFLDFFTILFLLVFHQYVIVNGLH